MRSLLLLASLSFMAACSDPRPVISMSDDSENVVVTPDEPAVPELTPGPSFGHCEGSRAWFTERDYWSMLSTQFFTFTPDEGLVLLTDDVTGGAFAYRTRDGAALPGPRDLTAVSEDYDRVLVRDWSTSALVVRERESSAAVHTFTPDVNAGESVVNGALDANGDKVALINCKDGALTLSVHHLSLDDVGTPVHESALYADVESPYCWFYGVLLPTVVFVPTADAVVVGLPTIGTVVHIDLTTHVDTRVVAHQAPADEDEFAYVENGPLLHLAIAPDGSHVVTTGSDARLRRFKLPTLTEIDDGRAVSIHLVNQFVYAPPRLVSPTAISPDGLVIAEVGENGQPVLRDARDGTLLVELPSPPIEVDPAITEPDEFTLERSRPVSLAFSPTGQQLAVSYSGGVALFRCDDVEAAPEGEALSISVDGPEAMQLYDAGIFTIDVSDDDTVFATSVTLAENIYATTVGLHEVHVTGYAAGTYELIFTVDDGRHVGETTRVVTITE